MAESKDLAQVLFLGSGPYPLDRRLENDKYKYFSLNYDCYLITPVNPATKELTGLQETTVIENFTLIPFAYYYKNAGIRNMLLIFRLITKALGGFYIKKRKFKVVISPNPLMAGLCAVIISRLTGAKAIIEINGNFEYAFQFGRLGDVKVGIIDRIKGHFSRYLIRFTTKKADAVKLLYDGQLNFIDKKGALKPKCFRFHDFAAITPFLEEEKGDEKYILFVGFPWHLKGVDILIKAFNKISDNFPQHRLKIVGWCPEGREFYENVAGHNPRVELCNPVPHAKIIEIMTKCSLFVLPSRTEAMGRVLLEAMASRKPIIASNVDGIPTVIKDGFNGLLVEKENIDELAEKMTNVLADSKLANTLAKNGYQYVQAELSEIRYIENFSHLINAITSPLV